MQKFILKSIAGLLSIAALAVVFTGAVSAQNVEKIECSPNGTLNGGSYADVIVNNGCTLNGAMVYGSVIVESGNLTVNTTSINGNILAKSADNVTLSGATVLGAINLELSGNLIVGGSSTVGSVSMKESDNLTINGGSTAGNVSVEKSDEVAITGATVGSVSNKESKTTTLTNSTVYPGGITLLLATGPLTICGSEIGFNSDLPEGSEGSGGINVTESKSDVVVDAACGVSTVVGSVVVGKGEGEIRLVGAQLGGGDLIVTEQKGNVTVDGTLLGEISVGKTEGKVTIKSVTTESDLSLVQNIGDIEIDDSTFAGDARIASNKKVTLKNSSFLLEDVEISKNSGPVLVEGNRELSLTIIENNSVKVIGNTFTDAEVSKNRGSTEIRDNTGEKLSCSGNSPRPTGSNNTMTELKDGQCRGV